MSAAASITSFITVSLQNKKSLLYCVREGFFSFSLCDITNVIGSCLIYEIVKPVREKQVCMRTPGNSRSLFCIIVRKIVLWDLYRLPLSKIAQILVFEGIGIVLAMSGDKYLTAVLIRYGIDARLIGGGKYLKSAYRLDILAQDGGMAGMRCHKLIVKAAEKDRALVINLVRKYTEHLFRQSMLLDAVVIIKTCLSAPADVEA